MVFIGYLVWLWPVKAMLQVNCHGTGVEGKVAGVRNRLELSETSSGVSYIRNEGFVHMKITGWIFSHTITPASPRPCNHCSVRPVVRAPPVPYLVMMRDPPPHPTCAFPRPSSFLYHYLCM